MFCHTCGSRAIAWEQKKQNSRGDFSIQFVVGRARIVDASEALPSVGKVHELIGVAHVVGAILAAVGSHVQGPPSIHATSVRDHNFIMLD